MAQDLTIRLLGRPKVSKDNQSGFQRVARRYVVQGPRASKAGIVDSNNPLFLAVGTADEEFTDHLLTNQQIEPAQGSMDKAYLVREFTEIRNTWNSEASTESGDLKRMQRKYTVIRAEHARGYGAAEWAKHPHNSSTPSNDPWDYLPEVIKATEPTSTGYSLFSKAGNTPEGLKPPMLESSGVSLGSTAIVSINSEPHVSLASALNYVASGLSNPSWLRATVTVDSSNPGIDVWSVSWAAPVTDYWTSKEGKKSNGGSSAPPALFDFDHNGVKILKLGKSASSGSSQVVYKTYISFVVGEDPGEELSSLFNGGGSTLGSAVSMDFHFVGIDGNSRSMGFRQHLSNTWKVIDTTDGVKFPGTGTGIAEGDVILDTSGTQAGAGPHFKIANANDVLNDQGDIKVADGTAKSYIFNYVHQKDASYPLYQGQPIMRAAGRMDWTHYYDRSSNYSSTGGSSITPIFSHGDQRIWKIKTVFIS